MTTVVTHPSAATYEVARRPRAAVRTGLRSLHIDALRGVAAMLVLVAHASRLALPAQERAVWAPGIALMGQAGVVLFFVLSGYLVGGMWVRRDRPAPRPRAYAARRFLRIWPAYALAYVATIALLNPADAESPWQLVLHLLLLHSWVPGEYVAGFPVGWTLGIEAMFYLAAPFLPRTSVRIVGLWLGSAAFATLAALTVADGGSPQGWVGPLRYGLPAMIGLFCPGILVALRPAWLAAVSRGVAVAVGGSLLTVGCVAAFVSTPWLHSLHYQALAAGFGLVLLLAVDAPPRARSLAAPMAALGLVSYGLYLWHNTLMILLLRVGITAPGGSWVAASALLCAVTLPVAWLSWVAVERPALTVAGGVR